MENASKALMIAGAILLAILIIALGMFIYNQSKGVMDKINLSEQEIQAFNAKFIEYEGRNVTGSNVRALLTTVQSHNNANSGDPSMQVRISGYPGIAPSADGSIPADMTAQVQVTTDTDGAANHFPTSAEITTTMGSVRAGATYIVQMQYNSAGLISQIAIRANTEGIDVTSAPTAAAGNN